MRNTRIGIIGGGQLGMLLAQSAIQFPAHISIFDPNPHCSAASFTENFYQGKFDDHQALLDFGSQCDVLIFENENINISALEELEKMGKKIYSNTQDLKWIQDKGVQRKTLKEKGFPVPNFQDLPASKVKEYPGPFPIVQKWKTGGYDGLGVQIHPDASSISSAHEVDSIFEEKIDIKMEISVILACDGKGEIATYPPVEMVFKPQVNLVDYVIAPARISDQIKKSAQELCRKIAQTFSFHGVYAIELFLDQNDQIIVNEIAPRTHNSGHHTTSANITSQYEQQIRIALDLPLGAPGQIIPAVLLNLLADQSTGKTQYKGLQEAYKIPNVQYTFYGKSQVRPDRKMGHALILDQDLQSAINKIDTIRNTLTITSNE